MPQYCGGPTFSNQFERSWTRKATERNISLRSVLVHRNSLRLGRYGAWHPTHELRRWPPCHAQRCPVVSAVIRRFDLVVEPVFIGVCSNTTPCSRSLTFRSPHLREPATVVPLRLPREATVLAGYRNRAAHCAVRTVLRQRHSRSSASNACFCSACSALRHRFFNSSGSLTRSKS